MIEQEQIYSGHAYNPKSAILKASNGLAAKLR